MTDTRAAGSQSRHGATHGHRRVRIAFTAFAAALVACGPSGAPDAGTGIDVGSDAATEPGDAGRDASERPDAASAELVLSPARLAFEVAAPGCFRSGALTLSNEGNAPSGPLSFAIVGLDARQFALASHDCPETLATGARCVITVELRPTDAGTFEAALEVEASGRVATAELRASSAHDGCGWPPTSIPMFLEFGDVVVGTTSAPQTVTVSNRGGGAFEPLRVQLTGPSAASFSLTRDMCGGVALAGGFACQIEIVMFASSPGALSASLDVSAGAAMTSVPLTGTAVLGPSAVFVEPATADFGTWAVGASSPPITFTLRNPGLAPTGVTTMTIVGANPGDFAIDTAASTCEGSSIPSGGSCDVLVSFAPMLSGARSASLRLEARPGGIVSAALSGTGL